MAEYNKIADQDKTTARIFEALGKYQHSSRAITKVWYLPRIKCSIPITCTRRGFRTIWTAIAEHETNLARHGYSPEQIEHSKRDCLDMALLALNAD